MNSPILMIKKLMPLLLCVCATCTLPAQTPNPDGVPLLTSPTAEMECAEGEVDVFQSGAQIFLDRPYTIKEVPAEMDGFQFIRGKIDRIQAICRRAGMVYVITPSPERNPSSCEQTLLDIGFQKVNLPEFPLFENTQNRSFVYQKQMETDEALNLRKWGVIVMPK